MGFHYDYKQLEEQDDEDKIDPIIRFKTTWTPLCDNALHLIESVADAYASIHKLYTVERTARTNKVRYIRVHKKGEEANAAELMATINGIYSPSYPLAPASSLATTLECATTSMRVNLTTPIFLRTTLDDKLLYQHAVKANSVKARLDALANEAAIRFMELLLFKKMGIAKFDFAKMSAYVGKLNSSKNDHHYTRLLAFALYELYTTHKKALHIEFSDHYVDEKYSAGKSERQNIYDILSLIVVPDDYLVRYKRFREVFSNVTNIELVALKTDTAADAKGGAAGPAALPDKCQELIDYLNELGAIHYGIKHPNEKDFLRSIEPKFNALILKVRNQMQAEIKRGADEANTYESGLRVVAATLQEKLPRKDWYSSVKIAGAETVQYLNANIKEHHFPRLLAIFLYNVDKAHHPSYKHLAHTDYPTHVKHYIDKKLAESSNQPELPQRRGVKSK